MKPDKEKTTVIFRKYHNGDIIALFPYLIEISRGCLYCSSYERIGQHGIASHDLSHCTTLAKPSEYADLKRELENIGYNLEVKSRINYARVRAEYAEVMA